MCAEKLLHPNTNVNARHARNYTPLMYACYKNFGSITQLLLDHGGCNVNAVSEDGSTALYLARLKGSEQCVEKLLTRDDIDTTTKTKLGKRPIDIAMDHPFGIEGIV